MKATSRDSRSSLATITGHLPALPGCQRRGEPWASVEGIGAVARLDLGELGAPLLDRRLHWHDLDDLDPPAWHLKMGMILAEHLRGFISRCRLHH